MCYLLLLAAAKMHGHAMHHASHNTTPTHLPQKLQALECNWR
jgi:hypothetical protein